MVYFQQSLFGKMSWERFHQMTGWILEPSYPLSQTPMFQCLLLEDGQEPEWCEGERLTSAGGSWTPSIPYVFIGWVFLKLGTAYRLAAGSDFAHKLLGLGQTIGAAFADFAPGLALFDWLVGIVGAVALRLLIYFKSKNAKKFRRDAEYGSARWSA